MTFLAWMVPQTSAICHHGRDWDGLPNHEIGLFIRVKHLCGLLLLLVTFVSQLPAKRAVVLHVLIDLLLSSQTSRISSHGLLDQIEHVKFARGAALEQFLRHGVRSEESLEQNAVQHRDHPFGSLADVDEFDDIFEVEHAQETDPAVPREP